MKKLIEEYGITKVDALNCVDYLLGGKGKVLEADPDQELLFFIQRLLVFLVILKKQRSKNIDEESLYKCFTGMKGIAFFDTLGSEKNKEEIEKLHTGLKVLETITIGIGDLRQLLLEAMERNKQKTLKKQCSIGS